MDSHEICEQIVVGTLCLLVALVFIAGLWKVASMCIWLFDHVRIV